MIMFDVLVAVSVAVDDTDDVLAFIAVIIDIAFSQSIIFLLFN